MLKIATFNVNSVKARIENIGAWLKDSNPDIVCLQEIKCIEEQFPFDYFLDLGYNAVVNGQKTYNGVAILSKYKIEDVKKDLPHLHDNDGVDGNLDNQARYIEGVIAFKNSAIRVASIYVPNGGGDLDSNENLENSAKFIYKMDFFDRLNSHIKNLLKYDEMQFFAGDFNVACENIDIYDPKNFDGKILFHPQERQKFRGLLNLGLVDCYRALNPLQQSYSWWDYRGNSYEKNHGARIDYILASPLGADSLISSSIEDKNVRDQSKPSDHCPMIINIKYGR